MARLNDTVHELFAAARAGSAADVKKLLKDLSGLTAWKTYAYFLGGDDEDGNGG